MTLDEVLSILERDRSRHMLGEPCTEADLVHVEDALGCGLPGDFRLLLRRLGGGIFYERHEIFGARRLMLHDIELVPDLLTVRRGLGSRALPPGLLPFHRAGGLFHYLDLTDTHGRVPPGNHGTAPLDLAVFLERVVLPDAHRRPVDD